MKALNIVLRIVLGLLIISPILGVTGMFPAPTADMYSTADAFTFIDIMMRSGYITWIMAAIFAFSIYLIIANRMALAALLILPITVNIVGFHAFLDGGLFTAGAVMGNVLFLINAYFIWQNWSHYKSLWNKGSAVAAQPQA